MSKEEDLEKELDGLIAEMQEEREELEADDNTSVEEESDNESNDENENDSENNEDNNTSDDNDDDSDSNDDDDSDDNIDSNDNSDDNNSNKQDFEPIEVEVSGNKVLINSQEELLAFAKRGANSVNNDTKVNSEMDDFVNQAKLTKEELTLLADIKSGDVNAIAKLAQLAKIDTLDIDEKNADSYKPKFEMSIKSEVDKVASEILGDAAHAEVFKGAIETVPEDFRTAISNDASMLSSFSGHVRSGLAQKIIPEALKSQAINGGDFFANYVKIGREMSKQEPKQTEQKPESKKREISDKEKKLRDRAGVGDNSEEQPDTGAKEVWEMSESEFDEYVASLSK